MKYYHNQQAFELVSGTKDLNTLQKYGLTQDEIWELKGIKREGNRKVKETRKEMQEVFKEHYDIEGGENSDPDTDIEGSKRMRKPRVKYVIDTSCFGIPIQIDNCLCARLIIAGVCFWIIGYMFYIMATFDPNRRNSQINENESNQDNGIDTNVE